MSTCGHASSHFRTPAARQADRSFPGNAHRLPTSAAPAGAPPYDKTRRPPVRAGHWLVVAGQPRFASTSCWNVCCLFHVARILSVWPTVRLGPGRSCPCEQISHRRRQAIGIRWRCLPSQHRTMAGLGPSAATLATLLQCLPRPARRRRICSTLCSRPSTSENRLWNTEINSSDSLAMKERSLRP